MGLPANLATSYQGGEPLFSQESCGRVANQQQALSANQANHEGIQAFRGPMQSATDRVKTEGDDKVPHLLNATNSSSPGTVCDNDNKQEDSDANEITKHEEEHFPAVKSENCAVEAEDEDEDEDIDYGTEIFSPENRLDLAVGRAIRLMPGKIILSLRPAAEIGEASLGTAAERQEFQAYHDDTRWIESRVICVIFGFYNDEVSVHDSILRRVPALAELLARREFFPIHHIRIPAIESQYGRALVHYLYSGRLIPGGESWSAQCHHLCQMYVVANKLRAPDLQHLILRDIRRIPYFLDKADFLFHQAVWVHKDHCADSKFRSCYLDTFLETEICDLVHGYTKFEHYASILRFSAQPAGRGREARQWATDAVNFAQAIIGELKQRMEQKEQAYVVI